MSGRKLEPGYPLAWFLVGLAIGVLVGGTLVVHGLLRAEVPLRVREDRPYLLVSDPASSSMVIIDTSKHGYVFGFKVETGLAHLEQVGDYIYATAFGSDSLYVFEPSRLELKATIPLGGEPHHIAAFPERGRLYVSNGAGYISEIDTTFNALVRELVVRGRPHGIAVDAERALLLVANPGLASLQVLDVSTGEVVSVLEGLSGPAMVAVKGGHTFITEEGGSLLRVRIPDMPGLSRLKLDGKPHQVIAHASRPVPYVGLEDAVMAVDSEELRILGRAELKEEHVELRLDPSGRYLYVTAGSRLTVLDADSLRVVSELSLGLSLHGMLFLKPAAGMQPAQRREPEEPSKFTC